MKATSLFSNASGERWPSRRACPLSQTRSSISRSSSSQTITSASSSFYSGAQTGNLTIDHKPEGEDELVGVRFLSRAEIRELEVYPEVLYDEFWDDQKEGFPETKYLGLQHVDP